MATITATYLDDLGRIRITAGALLPNVRYTLQRRTDFEPTWVNVRGGGNISTLGVTAVDDYEYVPNVVNYYRLLEPVFYDSFNRDYPTGAALETIGAVNSIASTPDNAALDIVGDIDIRVDVVPEVWPPVDDMTMIAKYNDDTNNRSYRFDVLASGLLRFSWSSTGVNVMSITSTIPVAVATGERFAARVTFDADNGAGGRTATFYVSTTIDDPWVQLGAAVTTAGATTIFSGNALLEVGGRVNGTRNPFSGLTLAAQVRSSIAGAIVANPRFVDQAPGTVVFVDSAGRTWTVGTAADIIAYAPVHGTDWGVADTGQTWNVGTTGAGYYAFVNSGVGVIGSTAPAGHVGEMVSDQIPGAEDAEAEWSAIYPDDPNLLTAGVEWGLGLRALDWDNYYESNLRFRPALDGYIVELRIGRRVADVFTLLATATIGEWAQNERWNIRFRVEGDALAAKAWRSEGSEPAGWTVTATDTSIVAGTGVYVRGFKSDGVPYEQQFGAITVNSIPIDVADTAQITPVQEEVWLKSVTYPLFNQELECVDWDAMTRSSRAGFFDIKGRHEILGITDVGSSATFSLTLVTRSRAQNRALVALLTYGGVLYLQPPGDTDEACNTNFSGIPGGFVVHSGSVQNHSVRGQAIWQWEIEFTRVAAADASGIIPTTITWEQLWALIGDSGTWEDVWALWSTWQELWETEGSIDAFNGGVL